MEAIFRAIAKEGRFLPSNPNDFWAYMQQMSEDPEGTELLITIKPLAKVAPKMRMYAYLFGPLMEAAVRGYAYVGYNGIDRVAARYKLQAEFAKCELYNAKTGETEFYLEDLSKMTKARLLKFLQDCIHYIEEHLQQTAPDSEEYKMMKLTGHKFKSTRYDTKNP